MQISRVVTCILRLVTIVIGNMGCTILSVIPSKLVLLSINIQMMSTTLQFAMLAFHSTCWKSPTTQENVRLSVSKNSSGLSIPKNWKSPTQVRFQYRCALIRYSLLQPTKTCHTSCGEPSNQVANKATMVQSNGSKKSGI